MASSRSSGGLTHRRKTRLPTTPYDPPPEKNRGWFSGAVSGSAGALASGDRRALAGVLHPKPNENPCSSSCLAKDGVDANDGVKDGVDANDGVKALNKSKRKLLIKQIIEQETFSRVESYELSSLLDSRIVDEPIELEEGPARKMTADEVQAQYHKTLLKAKKEYIEKKSGTRSGAKTYEETCDLNPSGTEHVLQLCLFLKDSKVGHIDVGSFTVKLPCHTSSKPEELHSDSHGLPAKELAEICRTPGVSGLSPSQTSLSAPGLTCQNHKQDSEDGSTLSLSARGLASQNHN